MTLHSLAVLVVATVVAVTTAILSSMSREESALADRGERLLPDLAAKANDVTAIAVTRKDGTTTLTKADGGFVDASGYPVKTEVVHDLLASLSVLTIVENKTGDPARYADLDLAEPTAEDGAGTEIILSDNAGDEIVRVVAGRNDYTVGGRGGGQYVRTGDSDVSHLVRGTVKLPLTRASWFDVDLLEQAPETIDSVKLTREDGNAIAFHREGEALAMVDKKSDREVDADKLARLTGLFGKLDFVDVRKSASPGADGRGSVRTETKDGLAVTVVALSPKGEREQWAHISAESLRDEAKTKAEELSQKIDGFEFRLPAGDLDIVDWDVDDFLVAPQS